MANLLSFTTMDEQDGRIFLMGKPDHPIHPLYPISPVQNTAIGLTGEPVPPMTLSGLMLIMNS